MAATADENRSLQMKQGRLPFKVLDIKTALQCSNTPQLKRKHSGSEGCKAAKIARSENMEKKTVSSLKIEEGGLLVKSSSNFGSEIPSTQKHSSRTENNEDIERLKEVEDVLRTAIIEVIDAQPKSAADCKEKEIDSSLNSTFNSCCLDTSICSSSEINSSIDHGKLLELLSDSELNNSELGSEVKNEKRKRNLIRTKELKEKRKAERERLKQEKERKIADAKEEKKRLTEAAKIKRQQEKEEKMQKRLQEKEAIKQKLLLKKEQERKEKEEKQQEKMKEKEEKLKHLEEKRMLMSLKQEEKKRKVEEKQKKIEEKKRCEDEEEKKTIRVKAAFASFFIRNESTVQDVSKQEPTHGLFKPFEVKKDMMLASVIPANVNFDPTLLNSYLLSQNCQKLYLEELQTKSHKPHKATKTQLAKVEDCFEDVILVEDNESVPMKAKLFYFCENVRPPYRGTWRKRSLAVTARNPFMKDSTLDYEVDSDEEWDEGGPGESLSGTEDEKESEDDYEVDNEFFVPHGYLSADEEKDEDEEKENSPEMQKIRLKLLEKEFQEEMKRKCSQLKPSILGCFWSKESDDELYQRLSPFQAISLSSLPVVTNQMQNASDLNKSCSVGGSPASELQKKYHKTFPEEAMPHLISLIHANTRGKGFLVKEFSIFWKIESNKTSGCDLCTEVDANKENDEKNSPSPLIISKGMIELTVKKIATYMQNPVHKVKCWWVHEDIRNKYNVLDLPSENEWQYVSHNEAECAPTQPKTPNQTIMKFTRKITPNSIDSSPSSSTPRSTPPSGEVSGDKSPKSEKRQFTKTEKGKKRTMSILQFAKRLKAEVHVNDSAPASTSAAKNLLVEPPVVAIE